MTDPIRPVTRSDGVGAECDSAMMAGLNTPLTVCARLLECHAADGEGDQVVVI